jgi:hypothetical protein
VQKVGKLPEQESAQLLLGRARTVTSAAIETTEHMQRTRSVYGKWKSCSLHTFTCSVRSRFGLSLAMEESDLVSVPLQQ